MNYYNCETLLEQQAEIEKLKSELDALAARVEVFKKIREDWQGLAINDAKTLIAFIEAADATPAACLAQVRADAGRAGFVAGYSSGFADRSLKRSFSPEWHASGYANRVRQGGDV
jgi:hypothetical protein